MLGSPGRSLLVRRLPSKVTNQSKLSGWSRQIAAKGVSPRKPSPSHRGKVAYEMSQMRASFLVTFPRPPYHRLRRSFSPGRSLLVRRFQTGLQNESNSAGGNGGRLAPPFIIRTGGRLRLFPSALPIKLAGRSRKKSGNAARARRKFPKQVSCERKFSFLTDFPAVFRRNTGKSAITR